MVLSGQLVWQKGILMTNTKEQKNRLLAEIKRTLNIFFTGNKVWLSFQTGKDIYLSHSHIYMTGVHLYLKKK